MMPDDKYDTAGFNMTRSDAAKTVTLADSVRETSDALTAAGVDAPRREARWLIATALDLPAETFIVRPDLVLSTEQKAVVSQ